MSGWGQPGLFSHELQLGSLIADLLPRTGLAAAVGKPLRVLEFGTEQVAESRGDVGEGLRPGRLMVVCVHAHALPESGLAPWPRHWLSGKQGWNFINS